MNYSGIEKTKSKYCLIGSDPVNDGIIFDLSSLKNANARQLIYEKLNIDHKDRSKYMLEIKDYIISDKDKSKLANVFNQWAVKHKDMVYLLQNHKELDAYFGGGQSSGQI